MNDSNSIIDEARAALAPHGLFLRGVLHPEGSDRPLLRDGVPAATVMLIGNAGGSLWPAFSAWQAAQAEPVTDPLDRWSEAVIRPIAAKLGASAYFPSEKPWQPFQRWAMQAEGLRPSPLGILIHPVYGLWHGYRGAIGFSELIGAPSRLQGEHPCETCPDKPCLASCPAGAITEAGFGYAACRGHLARPEGRACLDGGCIARNACPVGAEHRYPLEQLRFHMAAL